MNDLNLLADSLFGWGFVVGAFLLFFVVAAVVRSTYIFKNAKIIKGKIVEMNHFAGDYLPTIEFESAGKTQRFKSKTNVEGLHIGQEVELEYAKTDVRLYEKGRVDALPKMVYVVIMIFLFFFFKAVTFLSAFWG